MDNGNILGSFEQGETIQIKEMEKNLTKKMGRSVQILYLKLHGIKGSR